jgi:hypothetical protein
LSLVQKRKKERNNNNNNDNARREANMIEKGEFGNAPV